MSRINPQKIILLGIFVLFKLNAYCIKHKSDNSDKALLGQVKSSKSDLTTNVIYIDPSAATNGTGTQDSPWNASALSGNPWQSNSTYLFKRGTTYTHSKGINIQLPGLTFGAYGTGPNPILYATDDHNFNGYGTASVYGDMGTLTIQDLELIAPTGSTGVNIIEIAFMYAKGTVNITNCQIHGGFQGIRFVACSAINVKVTGCEVYDMWSDGLYIYQVSSFEAGNNHVYNVNLSHPSGYPDDGDCIQMDDIPTSWIHNNVLDHSSQPGKFCILVGATTNSFVGNSIIENNTLKRQRGGGDHTVLYDGYAHGSQVIFRYNIVQDALLGLQSRSYDMQVYYNVFSNLDEAMELSSPKDYTSYTKFWNNTIYNCGKILFGYGEYVDFKNNIIHTATGMAFTCGNNITSDYNDYYNIPTIGGLTRGTNDIAVDPQFNNPSGSDFSLTKGSKCIGKGTNVLNATIDINGNPVLPGAIDMGAYESGSASSGTPPPTGTPPVVNITSPSNGQNFTVPAFFTITANASDADGTISKVEFYNGGVKLGESATAPYSFSWNNVSGGTYLLTAIATDNSGAHTTSSLVTVFVNSPASTNKPPTININSPNNGQNFTAPAGITITANASDPDGTISKVEFYNNGIKLGESATAPYTFTWNNVAVGTYTLTAVATDNSNSYTTSSVVTVYVNSLAATNKPPVINITSPTNGKTFSAPASLNITVSASDPDGKISKVQFYNGNTKLGESAAPPYSFVLKNVTTGSYNLKAVAIDNTNLQSTSNVVTIWVNEIASDIPSADDPESFKLYPNPNDGRFSLSIPDTYNNAEVTIVDLSGKIVYSQGLLNNASTAEFNLTYFKSGIYIMIIKVNNKSFTKKFVKL
jgi:hypothetical protein